MNRDIMQALLPGLKPKPGDGVEWAGRGAGLHHHTMVTWQGIQLPLKTWANWMDRSDNGLRGRLQRYPIENAMDKSWTPKQHSTKKIEKPAKKVAQYFFCPPVESLI